MDIKQLSQEIRSMWCEEMRNFELKNTGKVSGWGNKEIPRWDGGETAAGVFCKPVWPEIARLCVDQQLEPHTLIRAIFHNVMVKPPYPNMATGNYALEKYRQYNSSGTVLENKTKIQYEFDSQKSSIIANVRSLIDYHKYDERTAWRIATVSQKVPLSPLFRYCVSANQQWDDISCKYKDAAIRQYRQMSNLYNEVWGEWIPKTLKGG